GQVNMITRSGTNQFHGSLLENFQSDAFASRDPFLPPTTAKPKIRFNQFGGSLGGPILRNRVLFFTSYEGYREESGVTVQGNVATQATRNRMLAALPYPETRLVLDNMPQPNVPINDAIGRYTAAKTLVRFDACWLAESPTRGAQSDLYNVRKRIPTFSVTGLFGSGDTEILALTYDAYNLDQKVTRLMGPHSVKFGFRWAREIGFKSN